MGVAMIVACLCGPVPAVRADERAIEPPDGAAVSMAHVPVVEIGEETRPVVGRARRWVSKLNERVRLPKGVLPVSIDVPPEDESAGVVVEVDVSLRDPEKARDVVAISNSARIRLERPTVFVAPGTESPVVEIPVPQELVGAPALVTVVARELPKEETTSRDVGPWRIEKGDRLELGFGVEPTAWMSGHPPAQFRVLAIAEGSDTEPQVVFDHRLDPVHDARDRRWVDASIGLDVLAGRDVRFRLEAVSLPDAPDVTIPRSLGVFSNPRLRRGGPGKAKRPNVVLLSLDTLSARHTGAYGYDRATTPQLDRRLAREGARVRQTVVPVPYTPPSHMTMLTGLHPCAHGVTDREGILAPEDALLAEAFRAAGYDTAAFTENAYVVAGAGFARGFDTYVEKRADASAAPGFATDTFGAAQRWLASRAREPFFLFVHTYQVHKPYTPPRGYRGFFVDEDRDASDSREQRWKDDELAYDQEIRYADDLLGQFLDSLEAAGFGDDTIVVVTSDHGEEFGRDGWGGHGFGVPDEAILVPLVIRAPGLVPPGTVVDEQVGMVDLAPTIVELAGLSLPRSVQGQSFASLVRGEGRGTFEPRALVSRATGVPRVSVRTDEHKLVRIGKPPEAKSQLYDLTADPGEERPLPLAEHEPTLKALRLALLGHERRCAEYRKAHPATEGKDSLFEQRPDWLINRNEISRKLRSLGYVE